MTNEHTGFSRRKLLKAGAVGVPAAGVLAFGSTLVTATSANAISADGWWGEETSAGLQRFLNAVVSTGRAPEVGRIESQPSSMAPSCPGIVGGWEWVPDDQAKGSRTLRLMFDWLNKVDQTPVSAKTKLNTGLITSLQEHYGISQDGRLDAPSQTIMALQNEINQYVG